MDLLKTYTIFPIETLTQWNGMSYEVILLAVIIDLFSLYGFKGFPPLSFINNAYMST